MGDKISLSELYPLIAEGLSAGGTYRFYPKGKSMLPLICENEDSVVFSSLKDLKKGDIVLYRRNSGAFVIHRIVKVGETLSMCGDNQFVIEKGILPGQVLAAISTVYKKDRPLNLNSLGYRLYVFLLPLRRLFLRGLAHIKSACYKILKKWC